MITTHILLCLTAFGLSDAAYFHNLTIAGVDDEVWIVGPPWLQDYLEVFDGGFTLRGGGSLHFARKAADNFSDPDIYYQFNLRGRFFEYTVDLSRVECGCNAAGYFTDMPGAGGGDSGDWYCDANFINSQWCPEMDTLESNKYAISSALHNCEKVNETWVDCDRIGCSTNSFLSDKTLLGPGEEFTINTERPFRISHYQDVGEAMVFLSQDGYDYDNYFMICEHDPDYHRAMGDIYTSMVFTASLWGGGDIDMSWLDGATGCKEECNLANNYVTFSDFLIKTSP